MIALSVRMASLLRRVQGEGTAPREQVASRAPQGQMARALAIDAHLRAIRAKLTAGEQAVFDRGVARMREAPGGLGRLASLAVDDVIAEMRSEMRCSPLIPSPKDPK